MVRKHELGRWKDADGDWFSIPMVPSENGRWIKLSDYDTLAAAARRLVDAARQYEHHYHGKTYAALAEVESLLKE